MPEMIVSLVSWSTWTRNVGSSRMKRLQGLGELVVVGPLGGLDRQVDDRLGGEDALERQVGPLGAVGVAGRALDAHDGDDVAGGGRVDVFLLVGVDAEDPADPGPLPLPRVVVEGPLGERPLIDAHERDLAERLLDQLERHGHSGASGSGASGTSAPPLVWSLAKISRSSGLGR